MALFNNTTYCTLGIFLSITISEAQTAAPRSDLLQNTVDSHLDTDEMEPIPGGSFIMGSRDGDNDEQPLRTVSLAPFFMTAYEITEKAYERCVASGKCTPPHYTDGTCRAWNGNTFIPVRVPPAFRNPRFPVVCVTWHQARHYCNVHNMTLPTEAQWEYAARAGTITPYPWGDDVPSGKECVLGRKNSPQNVGSCSPNRWGLFDMIGNAWEWVNDYYDPEEYRIDLHENPTGPEAGLYRGIRGGGWYSNSRTTTVAKRQWFSPDYGEVSIGFRCVSKNDAR